MTVKELMQELKKYPEDIIVLRDDAEYGYQQINAKDIIMGYNVLAESFGTKKDLVKLSIILQ